jgi:hypothetical protein
MRSSEFYFLAASQEQAIMGRLRAAALMQVNLAPSGIVASF